MKKFFLTLFIILIVAPVGRAQRPKFDSKTVLFGNLHAHSILSKDVRPKRRTDMEPSMAFKYAMDNGLDFLAITDHHKATDSPGSMQIDASDFTDRLYKVAMDFNASNAGNFIAIPAIEWGNTKTGNHINVYGLKSPPPNSILDIDYNELIEWSGTNAEFIQFNHPNSQKRKRHRSVGHYGEKRYSNIADFVSKTDHVVKTISLITSVRGGHISGKYKHATNKTHRIGQWENYYKEYLNKGFHISPSANQDTHSTNWGTVTAARTAVWADDVSYSGLMSGFKSNRVYATEDDEMAVVFKVKYKDQEYWMGEEINLDTDEEEVEFKMQVWQSVGSDGDDVNEGSYRVVLMYDENGPDGDEALKWQEYTLSNNTLKTVKLKVKKGAFVYMRVIELGGKDNPIGDFDKDRDGIRDDMNDTAWTSPIWMRD